MISTNELTDQLLSRAKNLTEFVVKRKLEDIPPNVFRQGELRFSIQYIAGTPAQLFVPALTQLEAEDMVNEWFEEVV
jgi:hypothetical protein